MQHSAVNFSSKKQVVYHLGLFQRKSKDLQRGGSFIEVPFWYGYAMLWKYSTVINSFASMKVLKLKLKSKSQFLEDDINNIKVLLNMKIEAESKSEFLKDETDIEAFIELKKKLVAPQNPIKQGLICSFSK